MTGTARGPDYDQQAEDGAAYNMRERELRELHERITALQQQLAKARAYHRVYIQSAARDREEAEQQRNRLLRLTRDLALENCARAGLEAECSEHTLMAHVCLPCRARVLEQALAGGEGE